MSNRYQIQRALESAVAHQRAGRLDEAEPIYRKVLSIVPQNTDALYLLGMILNAAQRYAEAAELFERAIAVNPRAAKYYANLAMAVGAPGLGRIDEGIALYRKALTLEPKEAILWSNLGNELRAADRWQEGLDCYRKAVQLKPDFADAHCNLGAVSMEAGLLTPTSPARELLAEVVAHHERALALEKDFALAHSNLGAALLLRGDYERGLSEYEWRWGCTPFSANLRRDPRRQWGTSEGVGFPDVAGRTLLIYSEQGLGDSIHIIRYASLLARRGARVLVECPMLIHTLMQCCEGVDDAFIWGRKLPDYDWHIPMMSLPFAFGTRVESIPAPVPYIHPDPIQTETWRVQLTAAASGRPLRVGLVWAGNPKNKVQRHRAIPFEEFAKLAAPQNLDAKTLERICFVNLQKGEAGKQAAAGPWKLVDFTDQLHAFADTAALVANLDLVISVDTAVAHLAGALGRPTWLLVPSMCDWRWMLDRSDSPWYPTMRVFRQPARGQWPAVIATIAKALTELAVSRRT
ncbi:MAG TPA: tetratricopeptide repeat-containing glycosyltransferase family protein [Tepidisphaeraceae bacterium]|nr:tetratricopeptide repeat-containing glycosyltransferase family protein [Tepidisphaeraceae bacterium]